MSLTCCELYVTFLMLYRNGLSFDLDPVLDLVLTHLPEFKEKRTQEGTEESHNPAGAHLRRSLTRRHWRGLKIVSTPPPPRRFRPLTLSKRFRNHLRSLSLRRTLDMFKSGGKRSGEERKKKKSGKDSQHVIMLPEESSSVSATVASTCAPAPLEALPTKGKSWRRMKEHKSKKSFGAAGMKQVRPESPNSSSNSEGGFKHFSAASRFTSAPKAVREEPAASTVPEALPSGAQETSIDGHPQRPEETKVGEKKVSNDAQPSESIQPEASVTTRIEMKSPPIPPLPPDHVKGSPNKAAKSEPALNVYLNHRRMVSQSRFLLNELPPVSIPASVKMTRYQKLARETRNLVARLSGDIPSAEKIRQALKISAGSAGRITPKIRTGTDVADVTDPEFSCDEYTAAILLAELEGTKMDQALMGADEPEAGYYSLPEASLEPFVKTQRFAQLRSLYRSLERLNALELSESATDIRRTSSAGIIDFDLWRRMRQRERNRDEMNNLVTWIRAAQREGECYFGAARGSKWQGDSGLRIKDETVRNLTQKFKALQQQDQHEQYSGSQSLPANISSDSMLPLPEKQRRSSSLSHRQVTVLKSQLSKVYSSADSSDKFQITVPKSAPESRTGTTVASPEQPKLYVRSASDSIRRRPVQGPSTTKALSISGCGTDASGVKSGVGRVPNQPSSSTRAAIQYVRQLSKQMTRKLTPANASAISHPVSSGSAPAAGRDSRMSCSSDSSQQDYLLVLTPRAEDKLDDVEDVVKEWADALPAQPVKSSTGQIRTNEEGTDTQSSNSSVQTVIQRDVKEKVDFFENVIGAAGSGIRTSRSFSDLSRRAGAILSVRPQSMMDLRRHRLLARMRNETSPEAKIASGRNRSLPADRSYLNVTKKGELVRKCHYFSRSRTPKASVDALLPWIPSGSIQRNKTIIKGQEVGNVNYIKRRYEENNPKIRKSKSSERPPGFFRLAGSPLPPTGSAKSSTSVTSSGFNWSRRFLAIPKKQVSFPSFKQPEESEAGSRKKIDFTKVKPTLLSTARLALRTSQSAPPPINRNTIGSKPQVRKHSGSFSDIASNQSSVRTLNYRLPNNRSVTSPTMSNRSFSQGSVCSAVSSTLPTDSTPRQTLPAAMTRFDPSLHQPTYRYTPPPVRIRRHPYDLYATFPRRKLRNVPIRPPLPAEFYRKPRPPSGSYYKV